MSLWHKQHHDSFLRITWRYLSILRLVSQHHFKQVHHVSRVSEPYQPSAESDLAPVVREWKFFLGMSVIGGADDVKHCQRGINLLCASSCSIISENATWVPEEKGVQIHKNHVLSGRLKSLHKSGPLRQVNSLVGRGCGNAVTGAAGGVEKRHLSVQLR